MPTHAPDQVPDHWLRAMFSSPAFGPAVHSAARAEAGLRDWRAGEPVTSDDECRYLDALVHASKDPIAGARVGLDHDPRGGSVLSYLLLCCSTLDDLLHAAARYIGITRPLARISVARTETGAQMELHSLDPRLGHHHQHAEFAVAAALRLMRFATQASHLPDAITFAHARGDSVRELQALFGCEVVCGAPVHALGLSAAQLALPLHTRDGALHVHLTQYADILLTERRDQTPVMRQRIEAAILSHLPRGTLSADRIAAEIGISPRSLRRKLAEDDLTLRMLIEDLRRMLAAMYLDDPSLSLAEIALLLGFSDQPAFTTAYKRWTGQPPSAMRARR